MGDMAEDFKLYRDDRKDARRRLGIPCLACMERRPKGNATILLPGQRCRVDGYVDSRPKFRGQ